MYGPSKLDKCWILKREDPLKSLLSFLRRDDFVTPEIVHRRLPTDLLHEGSAFGAKPRARDCLSRIRSRGA